MPRRRAIALTPNNYRENRRREYFRQRRDARAGNHVGAEEVVQVQDSTNNEIVQDPTNNQINLQEDPQQMVREENRVNQENQPRGRRRKSTIDLLNAARLTDSSEFNEAVAIYSAKHTCGNFNISCQHCQAVRWPLEKPTFCCQNGKIKIEIPQPPPANLLKHYVSRAVQSNIRSYNNALALASVGCNQIRQTGFNPTFTIQGKLHHTIGSLLPAAGQEPKFGQIFFVDIESSNRTNFNLNEYILKDMKLEIEKVNNYVKSFKTAIEINRQQPELDFVLHSKRPTQNIHKRTINLPAASEVAALIPGENVGNIDIIIHCKEGNQQLRRISSCHRSYDPLHYVLMFPHGTDGWSLGLNRPDNKTLTATDFYCHRLQVRNGHFNSVMRMGRLTQQYAVDQWAKIEGNRLLWARMNQKTIRADKYQGLLDAVHAGDTVRVGTKIVLPPAIYGSPRFYQECSQKAMAIVGHLGQPDLFITITCDPKWDEITSALEEGEHACDQPDLTARVFKMKYDSLMDDLTKKKHILGEVNAYTSTIEFQKRGLPHVHILLILSNAAKPNTPDKINNIVCAEIPDKTRNPQLYEIVTSNNIHGPCGNINPSSPCMEGEGVKHCSKKFPKPFSTSTAVSESSYPEYRRRKPCDGGNIHSIKVKGQDFNVDNSFVVPYNPLLSLRYRAHINVEIVHTVQAVKYLYKYVTKGQDRVLFALQEHSDDEIENFVNARYISASEAYWRTYEFELHRKSPPVEKLPCHLPKEQTVIFDENTAEQTVAAGPPETKLTVYFKTNASDETARNILYPEFPRFFTWNAKVKKWQRRKRGRQNEQAEFMTDCVGRIPTISLSPHQSELYYLRMLLYHRKGATSFEDLRSVNDAVHPTFQEACRVLGLLEDDTEKDRVMEEATAFFLSLAHSSDPYFRPFSCFVGLLILYNSGKNTDKPYVRIYYEGTTSPK